jgi:hypothetical protein
MGLVQNLAKLVRVRRKGLCDKKQCHWIPNKKVLSYGHNLFVMNIILLLRELTDQSVI